MIKVHIKLEKHPQVLELSEGASVSEVIQKLDPRWREHVLIVVNGKISKPSDSLQSSDRVVVLPLMSGG